MTNTAQLPALQVPSGLKSEIAFNALREVVYEVEAENAVSPKGSKPFIDNDNFNCLLQRHLRLNGIVFNHSHWNRLLFYAAGEVKRNDDGRYSIKSIQENAYGSAVMFLLLFLLRDYGVAYASQLLYGNTRTLKVDHPDHDVAHAATVYLLSQDIDLDATTGAESVPSIVLRKLMSPQAVMVTIKLGIRCYIRNYVRKMYNSESFNTLNIESTDVHSDLYSTENCYGFDLGDPLEEIHAEYLVDLLNSTDGFTDEEISFLAFWRSAKGQAICGSGKNLRAQFRLLAHPFGITECRSRTLYNSIINRYRHKLGISCYEEQILITDFKSKATKSKIKRGLIDATRRLKSGKGGAKVHKTPIIVSKIRSHYVDHDDGILLREISSSGDSIFATVKERMNLEE